MKTIEELICDTDSAWEMIKTWMSQANKVYEILPVDKEVSKKNLYDIQISTKSPLGSVVYETGGITFENGWLRLLGSGCDSFMRNLATWNELDNKGKFRRIEGAMLIGDDVIGGFFAINGGAFEGNIGDVFYLAPEKREWENLNMTYSNFVYWAFTGDMNLFYKTFRWLEWEKDVHEVGHDKGVLFYPLLWTGEESVEHRNRSIVPIEELWNLSI